MEQPARSRMGSQEWVQEVFTTGPARVNKGPSKHTQYHQLWVPAMNSKMGGQGRTELCALLALEYFHTLGLVRRFKEQPFRTQLEENGAEIYPDFLVELPNRSLFVLEIKTERFITHTLKLKLDQNKAEFEKHGMQYLVWSDHRPLCHATRHHLLHMRRFSGSDIPDHEIKSLTNFVAEQSRVSFDEIYEAGFDLSCFYAAAWKGLIFIPLTEPISSSTKITVSRQDDLETTFLDQKRSSNEWWESL